jgi:hypothetical protein
MSQGMQSSYDHAWISDVVCAANVAAVDQPLVHVANLEPHAPQTGADDVEQLIRDDGIILLVIGI